MVDRPTQQTRFRTTRISNDRATWDKTHMILFPLNAPLPRCYGALGSLNLAEFTFLGAGGAFESCFRFVSLPCRVGECLY